MRPQMKEKPGAEVNTHKTSIRSRGNLQSSLLRSASPHLGRAGNPRRRWLAIQNHPAASSSGAASRPSAAAAAGPHRGSRDREAARGAGVAGGGCAPRRRCARRPPALHSLCMAAGRAPAAPCHPSPRPPKNITRSAHWLRRP